VTARYEPIDETSELLSCDEEPLDDGNVTAKKNTTKRKKKSAKQNEPAYIILSPDAATKSVNKQKFQFGTCSQLERDDSPTFFEETQKALRISESLTFEKTVSEKFSMVSSSRSIATRFTGTKSHWSVAARDLDGSVVQPEIIDMTDSPNTSTAFNRVTSETARYDAKAKSPIPSKRIAKSNPTINKDVPISTIPQTDTQNTNPKSAVVERDSKSSTEQPLTQPSDMPNFNGYTDEELSKQIAAYAFKPIRGRKKMIDLLEKCWQNKHKTKDPAESVEAPLPTANAEATTTIAGDQTSKKPSARSRKTKPSDSEPKAASRAAKKKQTDKPVAKKTKKLETSSLPEARPTSTITMDEIQDSEEEIIPSPTRIRMQRESSRQATPTISSLALSNKGKRTLASSKASTTSNNDPSLQDLLGQITKAIRLQSRPQHSSQQGQLAQRLTWHEKILLYDPIILEDLATWLNTEGFALVSEDREVSAGFVRGWCESQGICCTYRN
jgi:Slx4 endonuclease